MKVIKLTEKIKNLDKVVTNDHINAVTEMPPAMSDAYEDSIETDEFIEDELQNSTARRSNEPFLGAKNQPVPAKLEEPKINLEESLFEDIDNVSNDEIYAYLDELGGYIDYDGKIEALIDEFNLDKETAESYVWDWSSGLNVDAEDVEYDDEDYDDEEYEEEEFNEALDRTGNDSLRNDYYKFRDDIYHSIASVCKKWTNLSDEDIEDAVEWFLNSFPDDELIKTDSIKENLNESSDRVVIGTMTLDKEIPGWTNYAEFANYDEEVTALPSSSPVKIYPQGSSLGHSFYWSFDAVDKNGNNTKANGDAYLYDLGRFLDGSRGMTLKLDPNWSYTGKYPYLVRTEESVEDFDESLNEAKKSNSSWSEIGKEEAEKVDLWSLIHSTLQKKRDLAADNMVKNYKTPQLSLEQRYEHINTDYDGNIVVQAASEEELAPAQEVAKFHGLESKVKQLSKSWSEKHPDQSYSLTIIIPEDRAMSKPEKNKLKKK